MQKFLVTGSLLLMACGATQAEKDADRLKFSTTAKDAQQYDINKDGIADSWKFMQSVDGKQVVARKEYDLNFDGKVDVWRFYGPDGFINRDQLDMDFDGRIDVTTFYKDRKVIRKEL